MQLCLVSTNVPRVAEACGEAIPRCLHHGLDELALLVEQRLVLLVMYHLTMQALHFGRQIEGALAHTQDRLLKVRVCGCLA